MAKKKEEIKEENKPDYTLSKNQEKFVKDAEKAGLEIDYAYSGRFMFGRQCPAVTVSTVHEFATKTNVETDQMGKGFVIYARN